MGDAGSFWPRIWIINKEGYVIMLIPYDNCCEIIKACHGITPKKVLHIGAHKGEEAIHYQTNDVGEVIWFEANDALIPELERHLQNFSMKQQIVPAALWNETKTMSFKVTNNLQSSSFFNLKDHLKHYPQIQVTEENSVKAYRLDELFNRANNFLFRDFEFINIDTQGAELAILRGIGEYLDQSSLKSIYVEVNREELYDGIPLVDEIDQFLLLKNFFRIKTVWSDHGWGDALYLKKYDK